VVFAFPDNKKAVAIISGVRNRCADALHLCDSSGLDDHKPGFLAPIVVSFPAAPRRISERNPQRVSCAWLLVGL
jgi:hypothetical protein